MSKPRVTFHPKSNIQTLPPVKVNLISACFPDCTEIMITRGLAGSFQGSQVLLVKPWRHSTSLALQAVKVAPFKDVVDEQKRYKNYVKSVLPVGVAAQVVRIATTSQNEWGAVAYSFIGDNLNETVCSFQEFYLDNSQSQIKDILTQIFQKLDKPWYRTLKPPQGQVSAELYFDHEYGAYFPADLTVTLRQGTTDDISSKPLPASEEYSCFPAESTLDDYRAIQLKQMIQLDRLLLHQQQGDRLELKRRTWTVPLRIKLQAEMALPSLPEGQPVYIRGEVTARRQDTLRQKVISAFDNIDEVEIDPSIDIISLNGETYPNPLHAYADTLVQEMPDNFCIIHGDLHARNIIIDSWNIPWLIDFGEVRIGHAAADFVKLERYIRYIIHQEHKQRGEPSFSFETLVNFERALVDASLNGIETVQLPQDYVLAKAFVIIHHIRSLAETYMREKRAGMFRKEYFPALVLQAVAALKYDNGDQFQTARHQFILAAVLLDYRSKHGVERPQVIREQKVYPPTEEFDVQVIQKLKVPGGAINLHDEFYVKREADTQLMQQIVTPGTVTTIRAPRQTGKTSLLIRGVYHARQVGIQVIHIDLQEFDDFQLTSLEIFLHELAEEAVRQLKLNSADLEHTWNGRSGAKQKLSDFIQDEVLTKLNVPIILALDEADRLLHKTTFYQDFYGLLRAWHNKGALYPTWEKFSVVLVISTEPYLLINDINQSPFNVGLWIYLKDFDQDQVDDLNRKHGSPVPESRLPEMMGLLGGHPYLTRQALYRMVIDNLDWDELVAIATNDFGPFGHHLQHHYRLIRNNQSLAKALAEILRGKQCADEMALFRLLKAGLVNGSGTVYSCRCRLYEMYFKGKL